MKVRQTATFAGLATGAAIAFAPLATAAPTDFIDFDTINASQIASLNSIFQAGGFFTGVPSSAFEEQSGGFLGLTDAGIDTYAPDLTDPSQAGEVTPFLNFIYGVNPIAADISSNTASYNVFNGALIQFADSSNASLFQLFNPNEVAPADIFLGSTTNVTAALASDNPAVWFYDRAIGDLSGYFQTNLSFLQIGLDDPAAAAAQDIDFSDVLSSQVASLNGIFNAAAGLAGVSDDVVPGMGDLPFDTIATNDANEIFTSLIFGLNPENIADDGVIGSYHVLNGALTQFADAYNVGLYALLSGGELVPAADYEDFLFGAEASILDAIGGDATVFSAIGDFLTNGFNDLLGYFDPTALLGAIG